MSTFDFPQLDAETRRHMADELEIDLGSDRLYIGRRLNDAGVARYRAALPVALRGGSPESLADELEPVPGDLWIPSTTARNGRQSTTPVTAARTLAEGEFNRYYMRAICLRALAEGDGRVRVRRAKAVSNPRADRLVQVAEGDLLAADAVLEDIRGHPGEDTTLGVPRGPNSGLSLEFTS